MHLAFALLVALAAFFASPASAWTPASPLLPPDHWAVEAARRLYELGLAPDWLPAQRAAPLLVVGGTLREAARRAATDARPCAPLAAAWVARFEKEFPGVGGLLAARVSLGYQGGSVSARPSPPPSSSPGTLHLVAPRPDPFSEIAASAALGPHLAAGFTARATPWEVSLPGVEAVTGTGPVALSVGRAPLRYGPSDFGAVVAGGATLDRIEMMTTAPICLPGLLAALGDFALDLALARFDEPRHPYHPLLWDMQLSWRPHPRLTLGGLRGVMFGGALWAGIPAHRIPGVLTGFSNYRENNVVSVSAAWRLPTDTLLPLTAKVEWGSDDNGGAWIQVPAVVAGISTPLLPFAGASAGFEYAYLGRLCCRDIAWYTHGQYTGGWATGETPLGDPIGGDGRAYRLVASAEPFDGRLRLTAASWLQDRFSANLYAPGAIGRSVGGRLGVELRTGRSAAELSGEAERGVDGWSRRALRGAVTIFF